MSKLTNDKNVTDIKCCVPGCCYPQETAFVAIKPLGEDMPANARLRLTYHLQTVSQNCAVDQFPCAFTLINELDDQEKVSLFTIKLNKYVAF